MIEITSPLKNVELSVYLPESLDVSGSIATFALVEPVYNKFVLREKRDTTQ